MADFAARLKRLRKQNGLTQEALAQMLGKRKTTICNYESGYSTPSFSTLEKLAQIFDVSIDEILGKTASVKESISHYAQVEFSFLGTDSETKYEAFSMPEKLLGSGEFFIIQLEDDALSSSNLHKGDFILCNHQLEPENGDLTAVLIGKKTKAVRYFYRADGKITLLASEKTPPEVYAETEITIMGKAVKALVSLSK